MRLQYTLSLATKRSVWELLSTLMFLELPAMKHLFRLVKPYISVIFIRTRKAKNVYVVIIKSFQNAKLSQQRNKDPFSYTGLKLTSS